MIMVHELREQHQLQQEQREPQQRQKRRQQRYRREVMKELRVRLVHQFDDVEEQLRDKYKGEPDVHSLLLVRRRTTLRYH